MANEVIIDRGHNTPPFDIGASGVIPEESAINEIADIIIPALKQSGFTVIETCPNSANSVQDSLNKRCATANKYPNAKIFVSIHANAFSNSTANGVEAFTYQGVKGVEATRFLQKMQEIGFFNRGIKNGSSLAVINGTSMNAVLLELFFVTNPQDVDLYKRNVQNVANAVFFAITGYDIQNPTPQNTTKIDINSYVKSITIEY